MTGGAPVLAEIPALPEAGHDHPLVGQSCNNLGMTLFDGAKYAEAEEVLTKAARIFEASRLRVGCSGMDRVRYAVKRSPLLDLSGVLAVRDRPVDAWKRFDEHLGRGLLDDLSARQLRPLTPKQRNRETDLIGQLQRMDEQVGQLVSFQGFELINFSIKVMKIF